MAYSRYSVYVTATNTTSTTVPQLNINVSNGTSLRRARIYEFVVASNVTPADAGSSWSWRRTSTRGSGLTSIVANPLDSGDNATALTLCDTAWSISAPSITASSDIYFWGQNQRATYRWIAAPDGEFVVPATNAAGLALMPTNTSAAAQYVYTVSFQE